MGTADNILAHALPENDEGGCKALGCQIIYFLADAPMLTLLDMLVHI